MDTFRTNIKVHSQDLQITHKDPVLLLGSCFAGNIGSRMQSLKFNALVNPFGVIFNPASVAQSIRSLAEGIPFSKQDLLFANGLWYSFSHHGSFSNPDPDACLDEINKVFTSGTELLSKCKVLSVTFGTAWIFRAKETGKIVANCHKLPESNFSRHLLKPEEIVGEYSALIKSLHAENPDLKLLFTVSPVRHLRDGMEGNQLSKSILHLAIRQIVDENPNCFYFPAYEIMMDDLRDYRFYDEDMVHPNKQAIEYIWERFEDSYMDKSTKGINQEMEKLASAMSHRPIHVDSYEYKMFCETQLRFVRVLKEMHSFLNFEREEAYFSKAL